MTIYFNICEYTQTKCNDKTSYDFASSINSNNTCQHLSGNNKLDQKVYLIDEDHPEYGVNIKFKHGNACSREKNYGLNLQINCDSSAAKNTYYIDEESIKYDQCQPKIIMNSAQGCPVFSMPPLWRWTDYYNYMVAFTLITLGALLIQFGGKYYMASMCTLAIFGKMCTLLCIMYGFILPNSTP